VTVSVNGHLTATLTASGGCGRTRLAVEVAEQLGGCQPLVAIDVPATF
jgi:hypothetical protein